MKEKNVIRKMLIKGFVLVILFCMSSLLWNDKGIFWGIAIGSFLAYADFALLCLISKISVNTQSKLKFFILQGLKYIVISAILAFLFLKNTINPIACVIGFSVLWLIPFMEIGYLKNV